MRRYGWVVAVVALVAAAVLTARPDLVGPGMSVLQMNLCGSGWASCYTGKSLQAASAAIRAHRPDVVTLNEVCRSDVYALARAFGATAVFTPAVDRGTGGPIACRDGEPYGLGILTRAGAIVAEGVYPTQDPAAVEGRAWLCAIGTVVVCTTHLANANPMVAAIQCRYFFTTVVAALPGPVVVGGDLNLADISTCLPDGYSAESDGGYQFVVTRTGGLGAVTLVGMHHTTDHPGLLVDLARHRDTPTRDVVA